MTNSSQKVSTTTAKWTEATWHEIVEAVGESFRMTAIEKSSLQEHEIAKLLAAIPFLANCDHPLRTSLANLGVYMMSIRSGAKVFSATEEDDADVMDRLKLARFEGGDKQIVDRGMALIALNMLADYQRDVVFDLANQKHNPIGTRAWDYETTFNRLVTQIDSVECSEMDRIATKETIVDKFWNAEFFPEWF